MLLCYYVITKKIFPFNYSLQQHHATLYVYETYDKCNNTESSPRPLADNIYHFRRLSKKFPRLLSSTSKKQGGSEEIPKKMRNFVGSFDCIDKLKHALRQSLKQ